MVQVARHVTMDEWGFLSPRHRLMLFGEGPLWQVLKEYVDHYHHERNHQGKGHVMLFPAVSQDTERQGLLQRREWLSGLLQDYAREAACVF